MSELPEHVAVNREYWDGMAHEWVDAGERAWDQVEPTWGQWGIPENELHLLPDDMTGVRAIELECRTAYVSAWMARRGASVTGIDNSAEQLRTAQRLSEQQVSPSNSSMATPRRSPFPITPSTSRSANTGSHLGRPYQWIPEAHRLLRPGGTLVFLGNHVFVGLCSRSTGHIRSPADLSGRTSAAIGSTGGTPRTTPAASNSS